jgi:predicted nuclease of predicted toxin-antitoxin system
LLFLIDAQLPISLAEALRHAGFRATHVADIGLLTASDLDIWNEAESRSAILVTKDRDFAQLRATKADGPTIFMDSDRQQGQSDTHRANLEGVASDPQRRRTR